MNRVRAVAFSVAFLIASSLAYAAEIKVTLSKDKAGGSPATSFTTDTPMIFAVIKEGLKSGDKLRGVWIAEDVGDAAPAGTTIYENTGNASGPSGSFSLDKPNKGWPPGKYKFEIYVNEELASTTDFSIGESQPAKKAPESAGNVPDDDELKSMSDSAIVAFGEAINDQDFSGFYLDIASLWQEQTTAEKLEESFKDFLDKDLDLPAAIEGKEPVFDKPAKIDSNGVLIVEGHYPTKPNRIVFQLKYIIEEQEWKLAGINVATKE